MKKVFKVEYEGPLLFPESLEDFLNGYINGVKVKVTELPSEECECGNPRCIYNQPIKPQAEIEEIVELSLPPTLYNQSITLVMEDKINELIRLLKKKGVV